MLKTSFSKVPSPGHRSASPDRSENFPAFCRAYEKAGIFLAFIILQTDDEALLGINIKKVFI